MDNTLSGSVDVVAVRAATRVARLVSKARAINRDLILTLRGDFKAMPDYLRWHRSVWMGRARLVKHEWLEGATPTNTGGAK
jgi:hypothetical protein